MTARIFQPQFDADEDARIHAVETTIELAACYAQEYLQQKTSNLSFDQPALQQVIFRFWRDIYGYSRFTAGLEKAVPDDAKRTEINKLVGLLPVYIWSDQPRKTRIAAGFTYWMGVLRPFRFKEEADIDWNDDRIANFNTYFTSWAALLFLSRFGSWSFGIDDKDAKVRKNNYIQALRYRELSLVTLEFLYGSIFRPKRIVVVKT